MPYPEMFPPEDPDYRPKAVVAPDVPRPVRPRGGQGDRRGASTASDAPLRAVQLRVLGGAMARVPVEATAFAHRDRKILAQVVSFFVGPEDRPAASPMGRGPRHRPAPGRGRCLRQLPRSRGGRPRPGRIPRPYLGPARRSQDAVRPDQPLPRQPQHPAAPRRVRASRRIFGAVGHARLARLPIGSNAGGSRSRRARSSHGPS